MENESRVTWREVVFAVLAVFCLTPFVSPPMALAAGIFVALTFGNPFAKQTGKLAKILLQISVIGLGFGMNLDKVLEAGRAGILFTIATIFGTLALGFFIGKLLGVEAKISHLVSSGTAICGGSAIAAVAPAIEADEREISVSLGTVFILNSIALFLFPVLGHVFRLSPEQFGIWAAIAIHDTSSVVGAAANFSPESLPIATTVKLARALWIVPLVLLTSFLFKSKSAKIKFPLFILLFLAASVFRTYVALPTEIYDVLVFVAKQGLTLTLFFIGAGLSPKNLRSVGIKPLIQGVLLWIIISVVSLFAVWQIL